MRTTIDLPDSLYRAAKAQAALEGVPLKMLVERAIGRELGARAAGTPGMVELPLVRSSRPRPDLTDHVIAQALADDDAEHHAW